MMILLSVWLLSTLVLLEKAFDGCVQPSTTTTALASLTKKSFRTDPLPVRAGSSNNVVSFPISADRPNCTDAAVRSDLFVPIFVISRDRVKVLKDSIASYEQTIKSPHEIIILDHRSSYPPMIEYLNLLQSERHMTVHKLEEPVWDDALARANTIIQEYMKKNPSVEYYVVTDPDISLTRTNTDILLFFAGILLSCPDIKVIGPHLKISDIPKHYAGSYQGHTAFEWESQFWLRQVPYMATFRGIGYHLGEEIIDTTFALRRSTQPFARITCPCIRTFAPYAAVHLSWYEDSQHLSEDKKYYMEHAHGGVNNW